LASPVEVYDKSGRKVRAKMLVDAAGRNVRDPVTGMPLIVDEDFDINDAIAFGHRLAPMVQSRDDPTGKAAALAAIYYAFRETGPRDMQRSYNGMVGGGRDEFVARFRPAASYLLGVVGTAAGLRPEEIFEGAGSYYQYEKDRPWNRNPDLDTSGTMGNAPTNARWIAEGIRAYDSGRFAKPAPGNQGEIDQRPSGEIAPAEDAIMGGQPPPRRQEVPPMPNFAAAAPQPATAQVTPAAQSGAYRQVASPAPPGLPQQVIDAGNLLRANGYEITPRTMYLAHVLGPQAAVDLIKRTGSTFSPMVPSPDAATGDQMRSWVRALRLGPAAQAGASGGMTPAPDPGPEMPGQPNETAFAPNWPFA
jgi:hypothetical protein